MIGYLKGTILEQEVGKIILNVSNVGYEVNIPVNIDLKVNEIELYIYTHVREDQFSLFGFSEKSGLELFKNLLSVSGIGPKVALAIIGSAPIDNLKDSILKGDSSMLSAVSGVGKKTAEKAIIELQGKIGFTNINLNGITQTDATDIIDALFGLGFQKPEIINALKNIPEEITENDEKIKWMIKNLGKR